MNTLASAKLRALVVDDSAYNRQTITAMLESLPDVEVVGRAMNGKEALKLVFDLQPDVITLDLEMPEMDGFAFLRLLMNKRPTPVLVVSGYAHRENVFRALELGALDFIAKPSREVSPDLKNIERDLVAKIEVVRKLQAVRLRDRARSLAQVARAAEADVVEHADAVPSGPSPRGVLAIASSTGGPPAVQQLLCALPTNLPLAIMIAQHMPSRFTRAFADRLNRIVGFHVVEARDGHPLCAGAVYIAPGSSNIEVEAAEPAGSASIHGGVPGSGGGRRHRVRVVPVQRADGGPIIAPSADHLFKSLAALFGPRLCAVVLTGMGSDGRDGAVVAHQAKARVLAEDPSTAVMPGMPFSVIEAGVVDEVLPLEQLPAAIVRFADACTGSR